MIEIKLINKVTLVLELFTENPLTKTYFKPVLYEARKKIKWMKNILTEFEYFLSYTSTIFTGNKSGINVSENLEYHIIWNTYICNPIGSEIQYKPHSSLLYMFQHMTIHACPVYQDSIASSGQVCCA